MCTQFLVEFLPTSRYSFSQANKNVTASLRTKTRIKAGMQAPLSSNTERHRNFTNPHPRILKRKMLKIVRAFNKSGLVAYQSKKAKISNQLSC